MEIIIANAKDQRCADWLASKFTPEQIQSAVTAVAATGRRVYVSNVTKALATRVPDDVWAMSEAEFSVIRGRLRELRDEFEAKAKRDKAEKDRTWGESP